MIELELYVLLKLALPGASFPPPFGFAAMPRFRWTAAALAFPPLPPPPPPKNPPGLEFDLLREEGMPIEEPSLERESELPAGIAPWTGSGCAPDEDEVGEDGGKSEVRAGERKPFLVVDPDGILAVLADEGVEGMVDEDDRLNSLVFGAEATRRSHREAAPPPPPPPPFEGGA